jgi:hypothetical protein
MAKKRLHAARTAGAATAKYLPADPVLWLECCGQADIMVAAGGDGIVLLYDRLGPDSEQAEFLISWLQATPGGESAVLSVIEHRKNTGGNRVAI